MNQMNELSIVFVIVAAENDLRLFSSHFRAPRICHLFHCLLLLDTRYQKSINDLLNSSFFLSWRASLEPNGQFLPLLTLRDINTMKNQRAEANIQSMPTWMIYWFSVNVFRLLIFVGHTIGLFLEQTDKFHIHFNVSTSLSIGSGLSLELNSDLSWNFRIFNKKTPIFRNGFWCQHTILIADYWYDNDAQYTHTQTLSCTFFYQNWYCQTSERAREKNISIINNSIHMKDIVRFLWICRCLACMWPNLETRYIYTYKRIKCNSTMLLIRVWRQRT